ncbi:MAG: glycosyltransferase family 4 protein, partial [Rhodothermia bacterium]
MKLCIQWPTLGPYHIARLRAAARVAEPRGMDIVGLETARKDKTYGFHSDAEGDTFERYTVFQHEVLEDLKPAEIRRAVHRSLDELNPGAVAITSYSTTDARSCLEWCESRGKIAILMMATKADDAPRSWWRERVKSILLRRYQAAVVGGAPQEAYLTQLGFARERIFVGYDVVDNDWIVDQTDEIRLAGSFDRSLPGLGTETPFFLVSARMTSRKNYTGLLEAYASYRSRVDSPWRLVALGDGPLRSEIESRIERDPIEGITLAGFVPYKQLPHYYASARAFVHTAEIDQWGLVVNEAMAASLPVLVSTGAGCVTDLVRDGENGYSFSPRSPDALAKFMIEISGDDALQSRMGRRSRQIIADWHPDRFGHALISALDLAIEDGPVRMGIGWKLTLNSIQRLA